MNSCIYKFNWYLATPHKDEEKSSIVIDNK